MLLSFQDFKIFTLGVAFLIICTLLPYYIWKPALSKRSFNIFSRRITFIYPDLMLQSEDLLQNVPGAFCNKRLGIFTGENNFLTVCF